MLARALVLALATAVFVVIVSISGGANPASPPTSFASGSVLWADLDCSGDITTSDPLQVLLEAGGLPGDPAGFCPVVGSRVEADGVERVFGDVNCDEVANARDAGELIAELAGIGAATGACPAVGAAVELTLLATISQAGADWRDYGDAPEGGPTLYTTGAATGSFPTSVATGPSHETPFAFRLGEFESPEEAPREDDSADDGLLRLEMNECATSSALLAISLSGLSEVERETPLTVNIFADWNRDGDWDDADGCTDEWALQNFALDVSGEPDFTILTVDFPGGDQVDEYWMRVMLTDQAYNPATDNLLAGETEDYLITGGQVFQPADPAQASRLGPLGGADAAGNQFLCRGSVIPHGFDKRLIFRFEQTTASLGSLFRIKTGDVKLQQPQTEDGKRATGVTMARVSYELLRLDANGHVKKTGTDADRALIQIVVTIDATLDAPDRLEGPFIIDVFVEGVFVQGFEKERKDYEGSRYCVFYVDHSADAVEQGHFDGFTGGPGRAAVGKTPKGEFISLASADPKFIFRTHGKPFWLEADAVDTNCRGLSGSAKTDCEQFNRFSQYDKSSVTVFGTDGAVIAPADLAADAGIKKIKVPKNRRRIKIYTVKDDHVPPVQRLVIRVKGQVIFNNEPFPFWDYYRVFIVHERGAKATQLQNEYMRGSVAFLFEENEATTVVYVRDGETLVSQEAPLGDAIFDDTEVICDTGGTRVVAHPFHNSSGVSSYGFILDAADGQSSEVYYIPPSNQVSRSVSGLGDVLCPPQSAVKVGPDSEKPILEATGCGDKSVWSEIDPELGAFSLAAATLDGLLQAPIPGGESYRDPSCATYDGVTGVFGSTPGAEGRSEGGFVGFIPPCNATCTESLTAPKVILPADGPNVHMLGLAVSPDAMKIAWYRSAPGDSQVWVGDFDPFTQTVSNHQQLTTEGFNFDPTWSPDGDQIAFVSSRDGNLEIYVMFADGSDQTNITETADADETEPSWHVP